MEPRGTGGAAQHGWSRAAQVEPHSTGVRPVEPLGTGAQPVEPLGPGAPPVEPLGPGAQPVECGRAQPAAQSIGLKY